LSRADFFLAVRAVVVAIQRKRKRRLRPPWGNILGGKPIERQNWLFNEKIEWDEEFLRTKQFSRMRRIKNYYGIVGGDKLYPIQGVGPTDWLPWYELALRIASELDDSLKIIEALPRAKTAARWRGTEGLFLLRLVDAKQETHPNRSIRWSLEDLRKRSLGLKKISLKQLVVRYHEAKKHFAATKKARRKRPSS
jgi:hypothetical protein